MSGPFGSSQWMYNSSTEFYGFDIENSLRFNDDDSAFLSRTPSSAGNRRTFTFSCWVKRANIPSGESYLFSTGTDANNFFGLEFIGGEIALQNYNSGTQVIARTGTDLFRDSAAWYSIVLAVDTTESTQADRLKLYVNGTQVTSFDGSDSDLSLNYDTQVNNTNQHTIGCREKGSRDAFHDGYLAEVNFIDGTALGPTSFGETKENIWIPKDTSGLTFGTNGFRLQFKNSSVASASSSTVGADTSGNNHHFSSNNIATTDNMLDSPTDNFNTLNPLNKNNVVTLSNGNLSFTASNNRFVTSTFAVNSGKWYLEFSPTAGGGSGVGVGIILATTDVHGAGTGAYSTAGFANSGTYTGVGYTTNGNKYVDSVAASYGDGYGSGNVIAIALDLDSSPQTIAFYKDNSSQGSINISPSNETWTIATDFSHPGTHSINFGQLAFTHTPPTGFVALSTANLPDPAIDPAKGGENPTDYFNTVTYSGTSGDKAVTGVGFQPDWVWIKQRNSAADNQLYDSVRGVTKLLESNQTLAEQTKSEGVKSFDSDGFTHGVESAGNDNSGTHVAWNWKAGTSFSNDASATGVGTIDSTGSVSTEAGFSVISYTGNGSNNATVAHGLGAVPSWVITKARDNGTDNWAVFHSGLTSIEHYIQLNLTGASASGNDRFGTNEPTSSVMNLGYAGSTNTNGRSYIMYCFAPKEGFSKFGTYDDAYISNYDTDSPFVYTGFRPAWLMIKGTSDGREWVMYDNKRTPDNGVYLRANTSAAEQTDASNHDISFLSNGFKIRGGSGDINTTNESYIYMAFADQPFKFANGGTE